jgi:hypothetical protein
VFLKSFFANKHKLNPLKDSLANAFINVLKQWILRWNPIGAIANALVFENYFWC